MIGYTVGVTLILSCILIIISLRRLFSGRDAGIWGKATGACIIILACSFILWATVETPKYERQQAKINFQKGQEYLAHNDYEKALNSFVLIAKSDKITFDQAQPIIYDLKLKLANAKLEQAKSLLASQKYQEALLELNRSLQYYELEEAKVLLPSFQTAAK